MSDQDTPTIAAAIAAFDQARAAELLQLRYRVVCQQIAALSAERAQLADLLNLARPATRAERDRADYERRQAVRGQS